MGKIKCLMYKLYDGFKLSPISRVFYWGNQYRVVKDETTVVGIVKSIEGGSIDGDFNFNVVADDSGWEWHCEVTPCAGIIVRLVAIRLKVEDHITVKGRWTHDPDHLWFMGGGNEIHPVTSITKVE